ncbi:TauD/TfdA family dioxygenase [Mucilaginibacter sp. P25]|uniref:TauD/TfdA family dioxygenase n=1 Tax=Mucilaginibacter sp. P25 TaxID=3423945 RepID=UPI003D7BEF70
MWNTIWAPLSGRIYNIGSFFGDGSEINEDEYLEIKKAYAENVTTFPYQQGDIIFVDNMLVAHGRNPYKGDRVIATAIIDPVHDSGY